MPGLKPSSYGGKPGRKGLKPSRGCAGGCTVTMSIVRNQFAPNPCTFSFTANVTNGPATSYLWDFGDGTTSTAAAPQKIYTDGILTHLVTLVVTTASSQCEAQGLAVCANTTCATCEPQTVPRDIVMQVQGATAGGCTICDGVNGTKILSPGTGGLNVICPWRLMGMQLGTCTLGGNCGTRMIFANYQAGITFEGSDLVMLGEVYVSYSTTDADTCFLRQERARYRKVITPQTCRGTHVLIRTNTPAVNPVCNLPDSITVTL